MGPRRAQRGHIQGPGGRVLTDRYATSERFQLLAPASARVPPPTAWSSNPVCQLFPFAKMHLKCCIRAAVRRAAWQAGRQSLSLPGQLEKSVLKRQPSWAWSRRQSIAGGESRDPGPFLLFLSFFLLTPGSLLWELSFGGTVFWLINPQQC